MLKITLLVLVLVVIIFVVPRCSRVHARQFPARAAPRRISPVLTGRYFSQLAGLSRKVDRPLFLSQRPDSGLHAGSAQLSGRSIKVRSAQLRGSGVSVDSVNSHKKFCAKEGLNFSS